VGFYYSSIIFLYGAELTRLSAKALGWSFEPIEAAEELDKERTRERVTGESGQSNSLI
jgi:uncharacterized BrkB/YihY/UPF0761 family membrane protein